ncbi:hypothetical protein Daesc_007821 [Daldinia eschscholtzii]|uniref:Uncharacterized protein n=1 Tax=Daldinia eschscholtzii TaxID=292717 RepID=A0AAX6MF58_9PEZI
MRARGITIFQFFGKAAQFFGTNVNPVGLDPDTGIGWKFLIVYCCWIAVEGVLIFFLWPETSGRTLEELTFCMFLEIFLFQEPRLMMKTVFEDDERAHAATEAVEKQIHQEEVNHHEEVDISKTTTKDQV